jgi:hypothetical protein
MTAAQMNMIAAAVNMAVAAPILTASIIGVTAGPPRCHARRPSRAVAHGGSGSLRLGLEAFLSQE